MTEDTASLETEHYLCYATYALDTQQDSAIGPTLVSLSRIRLPGCHKGSKNFRCGATWTSTETYVSFLNTKSNLYLYKFNLLRHSARQLQEYSFPTYYGRKAQDSQALVIELGMNLATAATHKDFAVQFFPGKSARDCPFLLINTSPDAALGSLSKVSLSKEALEGWEYIGDDSAKIRDFQPSYINPAFGTSSDRLSCSVSSDSTLLFSNDVVLSHSLCGNCHRVIRNSKLLNDPNQWTVKQPHGTHNDQPTKDHSSGIGRQ